MSDNIDSWLDPNGKIIKVCQRGHNEYASELIEKEMGLSGMWDYIRKTKNINYPYEVLHHRGWIRVYYDSKDKINILGGCIDLTEPMRNTMDPKMNIKQLSVAKRLCKDNGLTLQDAINDDRFIS